jgi:CDGSH-type Zn-finger protein
MAEPIIAQRAPYGVDVEGGKEYWWCACGRSQKQPFCDGSHKGTGLTPMQYNPPASQKVWFCGCKNTASKPTCDGTHKRV